jgi:hypothetical protein
MHTFLKLCLSALLLLSHASVASDISFRSGVSFSPGLFVNDGAQFALNLQRMETDWLIGGNLTENRINRLFISFYETPYTWFRPGLKLGYVTLAQTNNPVTAGRDLNGEMIGVSAQFATRSMVFNPRLDIDYIYHQTDANDTTQNIIYEWFELNIKAGFMISFGRFHFTMGGFHHSLDGDEFARGAITRTGHFEEDEPSGGFVDFTLFVDRTGSVSVQIEGGGRESANLIFAREF